MQEFCVCIKKRTRTKGTSDWEWLAIWTLYALLGQGRYLTTATLIDSLCPLENWHSNTTWTWDVWKTFFVDPGRCELVSWGAQREPGRLTTIIIIIKLYILSKNRRSNPLFTQTPIFGCRYIYIYPNIQIHLFTYIANNILSTYTTIRIHNNVMFFLNLNIVYEGSVYLNNFLVRSIPQKVEGTP